MGEAANHLETETTFAVPRRWTFPRLVGHPGLETVTQVPPADRFSQSATYLDTRSLALLRTKHTLRRRTGGTDAGWHLKKPRGGDTRLEMQQPLGRSAALVPAPFRQEVAPIVQGDALVPIATLRTRRAERRILGEHERVIALVADDSVEATVHLDGDRIQRWREVEVEVVDGTPAEYAAILAAFTESGLTVSTSQSKLGRAMGDVLERLAKVSEPTAGDVVLRYVSAQVGALQAHETPVREDVPDAVHKARVATRRLRSALHTFRPLLDTAVTEPLRAEISWLTGALGAPRDAEVMRDRLLQVVDGLEGPLLVGPVAGRLRDTLTREHDEAHARLVVALDGRRYERLMADLQDLVLYPPLGETAGVPAKDAVPKLVKRAARAVVKVAEVAEAAEAADSPDAAARDVAIHEIRKKAKAARYAAEAAGPAFGKRQAASVDAWTQLQEALGGYQDSVVAREVLARICADARATGEDTFTYGVLTEREAAGARAVLAQYDALLTSALTAAGARVKGRRR